MDLTALSDEDLALALQAGNEAAFDELVRRHQGRVYAVVYRITLNREDALDTAQDAFVKAYRKIHLWRPTSGFVPWLMRLAANQAIDTVRHRNRRQHDSLEARMAEGRPVQATELGRDTASRVRAGEVSERVQEALVVLSPAQRAVFTMRHHEGLAIAEIAEALECTTGSVKVHLFRAVRKLRDELSDLKTE